MRPDKKKKPYKGKSANVAAKPTSVPESSLASPAPPQTAADTKTDKSIAPVSNECKAVDVTQLNLDVKEKESDTIDKELTETTTKTFAKRKVFSNWERYVEPKHVCEVELEERQALDFESLLKAPVSADGHFFFKSEKLEAPPTSNLFTLDLQLLSDGLKSIPFYRQLDLPLSYFSASEIEKMDRDAANVLHELSGSHVNKMVQLLTTNAADEFTLAAETATHADESTASQVTVEPVLDDKPLTLTEKPVSQFLSKPQRTTSSETPKPQREKYIAPKSSSTPVTLKFEPMSTSQTSSFNDTLSLPQESPSETVVQTVAETQSTETSTSSPEAVVQAVLTEPPKGQRERKPRKSNAVTAPNPQARLDANKNEKVFELTPTPVIDNIVDELLADDHQVNSLLNKKGTQVSGPTSNCAPVTDSIVDELLADDNQANKLRQTQSETSATNAKSSDDLEAWLDSVLDD